MKQAILAYVETVTTEGGPGFVPVESRIAVFDNDGTLWSEQPIVMLMFVAERAKEMAKADPKIAADPAVQALLGGKLGELDGPERERTLMRLLAITATGMPPGEFADSVGRFLAAARHPKLGVPYRQTVYQPMLELLAFLRENGFKTWMCTGGGVDWVRVMSESYYGIPPKQVIGSTGAYEVTLVDGKLAILKKAELTHINDKEGKVAGILAQIGRIPIIAAGNERSGGDIAMLTYAQSSPFPSFQLMVDHDDAEREFAYAEKDGASLEAAQRNGWHVVSIKADWLKVYPGP